MPLLIKELFLFLDKAKVFLIKRNKCHLLPQRIRYGMPTLSQSEIRARAEKFAADWAGTTREEAEAQSFQNDFFHIFGIERRKVAIFEHRVKCDGGDGYIDLFWKGRIMIEMKSRGKSMEKAWEQARRYAATLREHEMPRCILICDFEHWDVYDLDRAAEKHSFTLAELPQHIHRFFYLAGYDERSYQEEDAVNVQAAELMGRLHDCLKADGYEGHALELYLVRLLFCLFADDTGIFEQDDFHFLLRHSAEDGHDLAPLLAQLFQVLNTPEEKRLRSLDARFGAFRYVNGGLFAEYLPMPAFNAEMRRALLDCCALDWGAISPAIFGSMFQSVMKPEERRALGAHYTSERNILKLIRPLFLDALREEFERIRADKSSRRWGRLEEFQSKLAGLTFLDPACGCGNFPVVSYRELRRLELEVIRELHPDGQRVLDVAELCRVSVNQFYGIEIEEFPAQIAQVAMWLMDHQMNLAVGNYFGQAFARLPLKESATIICANALRTDWEDVVPKEKLSYIMGNPPFVGARNMSREQKTDLVQVFEGAKGAGDLDFVAAWYGKAADYMQGTEIHAAFVSTNSICQGQAVAILWKYLSVRKNIHITFAHRTFKWSNEARGQAAVHCVIVGFAASERIQRNLLMDETGESRKASHINGYLVDAADIFIDNRTRPICSVPEMGIGNKPIDGGNYLFSPEEKEAFIAKEPLSEQYFKPWMGSQELIKGLVRYCLWLGDCNPTELRKMPEAMKRVEAVRKFRATSKSAPTQAIAETPRRFHVENMPKGTYVAIPETSSERRMYIPIAFYDENVLCSNALRLIPNATLYHFGVLTSTMHMAWTRAVCGRLEMRYRYSNKIVYNNYPWPEVTAEQESKISELAQGVLDARALYPECSLADLYDPLTMPPELVAAHRKLDAAVERAYGRRFADDAERVAFLFEKYRELTEGKR